MVQEFKCLNLKSGDYIDIMIQSGIGYDGIYEGGYDNSKETFLFSNHTNGQTQTIEIEKLQGIKLRMRRPDAT